MKYGIKTAMVGSKFMANNFSYTPFIVIGQYRTGSNYLCSLLESHANIHMHASYEIFHKSMPILSEYFTERELGWRLTDPVKFIQKCVFVPRPSEFIKAVGFKIHYDQMEYPHLSPLMLWLRENTSVHVIHLRRKNLLAVYASYKIAEQTKQWTSLDRAQKIIESIELDPAKCADYFELTERAGHYYDKFFARHPRTQIVYEDFCADASVAARQIYPFLGVNWLAPSSSHAKINTRPLSQVITNYRALASHFARTKWALLFDRQSEPNGQ